LDDIEQVAAISDPVERAQEIARRMALLPEWSAKLREMRQAAVLEMRANGMSHADVGRALGVHRNRAQQIAEGRSSGGQGGGKELEAAPEEAD
jgi:hypothetical protein